VIHRLSEGGSGGGPPRPDERWFEEVWAERDQSLFKLFGQVRKNPIALPPPELVRGICGEVDPRWLRNGVYVFEPTSERNSFAFCTAGLSTPWDARGLPDDPRGIDSGLGFELCLELDRFDLWAVDCLTRLMFYQVAVAAGRRAGRPIHPGEWLPFRPLLASPGAGPLRAFATLLHPSDHFLIRSGRVELVQLIGMTRAECAWIMAENLPVSSFLEKHVQRFGRVTLLERSDLDVPDYPVPPERAKYLE
jgi:hypothetical protein